MISLMIMCVEAMKALCCLVIFCWRVHSVQTYWLSPHSSCHHAQSYMLLWGCWVDFEPPWVTAYHFTEVWARLCYWFLCSWLQWLLCQDACFRVGCYFVALFYIGIIWFDWENHEGYGCSHCYYGPTRSLCFLYSFSLLPSDLSPCLAKLLVIWPMCPPCCLKSFSVVVGGQL